MLFGSADYVATNMPQYIGSRFVAVLRVLDLIRIYYEFAECVCAHLSSRSISRLRDHKYLECMREREKEARQNEGEGVFRFK